MSLPAPFIQSFHNVASCSATTELKIIRPKREFATEFDHNVWNNDGWVTERKKLTFEIQAEQLWILSRNWKVWSECGFMFSPDGKIVLDGFSFPYPAEAIQNLKRCAERAKPEKTQHIRGSLFVFSNVGYANYYHVVTELLPRLEMLEHLDETPKILVMHDSPLFVYEALERLGISREQIVAQHPDTMYSADKLITTNYGMNFIPEKFDWLKKKVLFKQIVGLDTKTFVHRVPGLPRSTKDDGFLKGSWSEEFDIVESENARFSSQVRMGQESKLMMGIHGAGLTNSMWMNPPKVVEFRPKNFDNRCYLHLALTNGAKEYFLVEIESEGQQQTVELSAEMMGKITEKL